MSMLWSSIKAGSKLDQSWTKAKAMMIKYDKQDVKAIWDGETKLTYASECLIWH